MLVCVTVARLLTDPGLVYGSSMQLPCWTVTSACVIVQATHAFPAVLEKLELHAFDMCKIIDPFVRYEPSTPRDLKRHLHSIEEKIVESLAWERGSSLYPLLVMAAEHQDTKPVPAKGQLKSFVCICLPTPTCLL